MGETSNPSQTADYLLIVGFFVVMLVIGFYYAGRVRDTKDYFAGSHQVPWWLSSVSYWMSSFSAFAFVAQSAIAYKHGFVAITIWWTMVGPIIIVAYLVASRWRRAGTTSPMEFIEERYNLAVRQGLSYLGGILIVLDDALKVVAISLVASVSLGFPTTPAILCCGLIMLSYTMLGGLWAVLITDSVQFVVMLASVVVLVPLALSRVGGATEFIEKLPEGFLAPTAAKYTLAYLGALGLLQLLNFGTRWSLVQRFIAVPRDADARKVCFLAAALFVVMAPILLIPAMAASIFLPNIGNPDLIYGLLCRELLPVGMLGLLIAGIFSATMSSLSSDYNAVASVLTTDVYQRLIVPAASDRHYVLVGRLFTLIVGLVTIGIALLMVGLGKGLLLFDLMVIIFALLGPPTMIPVLAGLLFRTVSSTGAICGMITGVVVSFVAHFWGVAMLQLLDRTLAPRIGHIMLVETISETTFIMTSVVSTILGLVIGSILRPSSPEAKERIHRFLAGMKGREYPTTASVEPTRDTVSPLSVIGIAVATLGGLLLVTVLASVPMDQGTWSLLVGTTMLVLGCVLIGLPWLGKSKRCQDIQE